MQVRRFLLQVTPTEDSHSIGDEVAHKDLLERSEHFLGFLHIAEYDEPPGSVKEKIAKESFLLLDAVATKKLQELYARIERYDEKQKQTFENNGMFENDGMIYTPTLHCIPLTCSQFLTSPRPTTFLWFDRNANQPSRVFTSFTLSDQEAQMVHNVREQLAKIGVANVRFNDQITTNSISSVPTSNIEYTVIMMLPWHWGESMDDNMVAKDVMSPIEYLTKWFTLDEYNELGDVTRSMLKCFIHGYKTLDDQERYHLTEVPELKSNVTKTLPCLLASAWYQTMKMALLTSDPEFDQSVMVYSCGPFHQATLTSKRPTSMLSYAVASTGVLGGVEVERYTLSVKWERETWTFSHKFADAHKHIYHDVYNTARKALTTQFNDDLSEAAKTERTITRDDAEEIIVSSSKWRDEVVWLPEAYLHPMLQTATVRSHRSAPLSTARMVGSFISRLNKLVK